MPHKTCSYGDCKSDSRKRCMKSMEGVFFIAFPKPVRQYSTCKRWAEACGRADFTVDSVTRHSYVCSKHFVGGNGPTATHPDPIPFTAGTFTTSHTGRRVVLPADSMPKLEMTLPDLSDDTTESQNDTLGPSAPPQIIRYVYSDQVPETAPSLGELPSVYVRNDHSTRLHHHLIRQWQQGSLCDATLVVKGTKLPFHRIVLMAVSTITNQMLQDQSSSTRVEFQMPDSVEGEAASSFLHYLYHGILNVSVANARSIHTIATILQVHEVQQHCQNFASAVGERLGIPAAQIKSPEFNVSIHTVPDGKEDGSSNFSQETMMNPCSLPQGSGRMLANRRKTHRPLSSYLQRRYGSAGGAFGGPSGSSFHRKRFAPYSSMATSSLSANDNHPLGQLDFSVLQNIKLESVEGEEMEPACANPNPNESTVDDTPGVIEELEPPPMSAAEPDLSASACDLGLPFSIE